MRTSTSTSPPTLRKQPSQERSRLMVRAIEEACEKLLFSEGARTISPRRLSEVAGVEVGSLYQYFPNVEAVIASVCRKRTLEFVQARLRRIDELGPTDFRAALSDTLRGVVAYHADMFRAAPDFYLKYRDFFDLARYCDEVLDDSHATEQILHRHLEASGTKCEETETATFLMTRCVTHAIFETARDRPEMLTQESFTEYLLNLCVGLAQPVHH